MDWDQWDKAKKLLDQYNITPLIGVIPACADTKLAIDQARDDFWAYIKDLQNKGYTIAMHGYEHVYRTNKKGMVGLSKQSEFAGLSFDEQYNILKQGKKIFYDNGVDVKAFFAPSHSYDHNTLKALNDLGFEWVSDGKGYKAVRYQNLKLLPCINHAIPKRKIGHYITVVCHTNEWAQNDGYHELEAFCKKHREEIVDFEAFSKQPVGNRFLNAMVEKAVVLYQRYIKGYC